MRLFLGDSTCRGTASPIGIYDLCVVRLQLISTHASVYGHAMCKGTFDQPREQTKPCLTCFACLRALVAGTLSRQSQIGPHERLAQHRQQSRPARTWLRQCTTRSLSATAHHLGRPRRRPRGSGGSWCGRSTRARLLFHPRQPATWQACGIQAHA